MKYAEYLFFMFFKSLISIIPFKLLYLFSDLNAFILQHIIHYRHSIILQNLQKSFPGRDRKEIDRIIGEFYRNLSDVMVESIKGYTLDSKKLLKRYSFSNIEVADYFHDKNQDVILALSHSCNWEWGSQLAGQIFRHSLIAFYKPISNPWLNSYMIRNRTKKKISLLSIENPKFPLRQENDNPVAYLIISDQSPPPLTKVVWTRFLNQDTPCLRGIELYAKHFRMPVIYVDVQRVKRGYYTVGLEVLVSDPVNTVPGEITDKYMRKLESVIIKKPENWLWSHRRWKRQRLPGSVRPVNLGGATWEIGKTDI